jgi:hypothetical protein
MTLTRNNSAHLRFADYELQGLDSKDDGLAYRNAMTKGDIQLLYEYDRWPNNRVLQAASALSAEDFTRDPGGSLRSARDTLVHIISGEWIWLAYWKGPSHSSAFLTDLKSRREVLFNPDVFPSLATVQSKWAEIERS